jgi:hypothetical protein
MRDKQQIEAMYYLSPLQQGLLFHRLADAEADPYFYQYAYRLQGDLRLDAFEGGLAPCGRAPCGAPHGVRLGGSGEAAASRAPADRLPIERHDWRGVPEEEQRLRFAALLDGDRAAGLDLLRPPLMRLHVIRKAEREWLLVNSHHHILLDGWSMALVLRDVLTAYEALVRGAAPTVESPRPYRDYISWVNRQDLVQAETFWRAMLAGIQRPTSIVIEAPSQDMLQPRLCPLPSSP